MDIQFDGQVVLITGGAGGIGTALSRAFADAGAKVAITYLNGKESAEALVRELTDAGTEALAIPYDMSDYAQAEQVVRQVVSKWGRLDALVANAVNWPMLPPDQRTLVDVDWETWSKLIDTNLFGTAAILQQAAKHMLTQEYGRIVIMSTEIAHEGRMGGSAYSTAKAALHGLVASVRWELGPHNILINFVSPGFNLTPRNLHMFSDELRQQVADKTPTGRLSTPEDVAPTVVYLASKANRQVMSQFVSVSGGVTQVG